jgi:hypothetical protein
VGCLRRRSSSGADQAKAVPACFVSVRAAAEQRRLRAKGGVSAFAPTVMMIEHLLSVRVPRLVALGKESFREAQSQFQSQVLGMALDKGA